MESENKGAEQRKLNHCSLHKNEFSAMDCVFLLRTLQFSYSKHQAPSSILYGQFKAVKCLLFLLLLSWEGLHLPLPLSDICSILQQYSHHLWLALSAGQHQWGMLQVEIRGKRLLDTYIHKHTHRTTKPLFSKSFSFQRPPVDIPLL